jgi:hypothetical protein
LEPRLGEKSRFSLSLIPPATGGSTRLRSASLDATVTVQYSGKFAEIGIAEIDPVVPSSQLSLFTDDKPQGGRGGGVS